MTAPNDFNWEDPNLMIGDTNELLVSKQASAIEQQMDGAERGWIFDFHRFGGKLLVLKQPPGVEPPFIFHGFDSDEPSWVLSPDDSYWHLVTNSPIAKKSTDNPKTWGMAEFVREIGRWPPMWDKAIRDENYEAIGRGHYATLALWFKHRWMVNSPGKMELGRLLHFTELIDTMPYFDFSMARLDFAYKLYWRLPLAQRADSEEHLWFFMEYSHCLHRLYPSAASMKKPAVKKGLTDMISIWRKALKSAKRGDALNLMTLESLEQEGEDWRMWINELLVNEAIRLIQEAEGGAEKDLLFHTRIFLDAWAHYNGMTRPKHHKILMPAEKPPKRPPGRPPGFAR
jgi:hypothetical protein